MKYENEKWWDEGYGFFGDFYMEGDDSLEGYLVREKKDLNERTTAEVDGVVKLAGLEPGSRVLDCPCGYGRHSIALALRGFDVVGVDINSRQLEIAKEREKSLTAKAEFLHGNMLELGFDVKFDAVINMFYSFGFFERDEENLVVLENFYKALKPGGRFLMHTDVNIPFVESGKYREDEIRTLSDGKKLRIIDRYDPASKRMNGSWIIADVGGNEVRKDYSVRVYTKDEFVSLCEKVGFRKADVYSDWSGSQYSADSDDMIIVATK